MRHLVPLLGLLVAGACLPAAGSPALSPALCELGRQPEQAPLHALALIEIPAGGREKLEMDHRTGRLVVDRVLPDSLGYPAAYGSFPCTLAGDGDPLDLLVLTDSTLTPGSTLRVRPIGVLRMLDRGAQDDKLIAVLVNSDVQSVAPDVQKAIEQFFRTYKGPDANIQLRGWQDATAAANVLLSAIAAAAPL